MKEGQASNIILATSLSLNVALVGMIFWLGIHNTRILTRSYSDAARSRVEIQKNILAELESTDPNKLDDLKSMLLLGIDVDDRVAYKLETGERPTPRSSDQ